MRQFDINQLTNVIAALLYAISVIGSLYVSFKPGAGRLLFARRLYWVISCAIILLGTVCGIELDRQSADAPVLFSMLIVVIAPGMIFALLGMLARLASFLLRRTMLKLVTSQD